MGKANPGQHSFAGGELSPLLEGRQEIAKYSIGCRRMRNFFPLLQGPTQKRGGTRFIAEVKNSAHRTWLYSFVFSETDAVVLEYGDTYNRFFTDRATIESAPNTPYEITSPYAVADLLHAEGSFNIAISQSGDVMYHAHASYQPRTLSRTSNVSWAYAAYAPDDGPFDLQNIDNTVSVTVSAATGTVTLTNDAAGVPVPEGTTSRLIRIEETDKSATKPWEASKRIAAVGANPLGQNRRSDGKFYTCATNDTVGGAEVEFRTGTIRPIHTEGTEGDGDGEPLYSGTTLFAGRVGVDWTYLHAGYGVGRITAVAGGGATATVTTLSRFPASCITPGSYRWSLGAWYTGNFPSATAFFRDRLAVGYKQRVQISVAANYDSHAPDEFGEVLPDSAIDVTISVGQGDQINWMIAGSDALLIGTGSDLIALQEITKNQVFAPANNTFRAQACGGSRRVAPINIDEATVFVEAGGRRLIEALFDGGAERYIGSDLTDFAEHITQSGIVGTCWQENPNRVLWCWLANGKVAALTYNRKQELIAWSLHDFGGFTECMAVIPGPTAGIDDVWMINKRTIDGDVVRYIEVLLPPYTAPNDPHLANYQDCSLTYDGSQSMTLTPGAGATVKGSTAVTFTAGSAVFSAGDIDREIQVRSYDADTELWSTAIAVITGYTSTTVVTCEIAAAFASTDPIAADGWRLTATDITGLDHLEGETVRVITDGGTHPTCVVASGAITLNRQTAIAHIGLPVRGVVQTMNIEAGASDGVAQGKIKRFTAMVARVFDTIGGRMGPTVTSNDPIQYRRPANPMNQALPLFTGDVAMAWPNGYETEGRITFVHDEGLPCTLLALYPEITVEDKRSAGAR